MPNEFLQDALAATQKDTTPVINLAREMVKLQLQIEKLHAEHQRLEAQLYSIETKTMPDLMKEYGVTMLELSAGWQLKKEPFFRASIPAVSTIEKVQDDVASALIARREEGLKWLRANKGGDIIVDEVSVSLGKGQGALAKKIISFVKGLKLSAERTEKVHPGSLSKFLKEKISIGVDVPTETFGVSSGEIAKVTLIKTKGAK